MNKSKHRNGNRYSYLVKNHAIKLRSSGISFKEIAHNMKISPGTIHCWTRHIEIGDSERNKIRQRWLDLLRKAMTSARIKMISESARSRLVPHAKKYTNDDLLKKILDFYQANGRIPLKREFNMHREYKSRFGSWNAAIRKCGFNPNPELFAHKFKAKDGHLCDSFSEMVIDNWLTINEICHIKNYRYGDTKMTADFLVGGNVIVEFFWAGGSSEEL